MAHLKLDLAFLAAGRLSWWNPLSLRQQVRQLKIAACRAYAFHNLAWFLAHGLERFDEDHFWRDIEQFQRDCPDARFADYPSLFQRKLGGNWPERRCLTSSIEHAMNSFQLFFAEAGSAPA